MATLINNVGYLLQMYSTTEHECIFTVKMAYLGKVWIPFSLFMFAMKLCKKQVPNVVKVLLALTHALTFALLFLMEYTGLYYKDIHFVQEGMFPQLAHKNGIWHYVYDLILLFYIAYGIGNMIAALRRETGTTARKRLFMVILSFLSYTISFLVYKLSPDRTYDATALGYTIGTIFMYIAIFRYDLLETEGLARDYAIDELSEGIIAVDDRGEIGYFNKPALTLFPELEKDAKSVIERLKDAIGQGELLTINDRIYTPSSNVLSGKGKNSGRIYVVTDDTEHFRYVEELREQTQRADQASRAKSEFLSNMSHEIRTPINTVLGMDEMILREADDETIREYASDIRTAGQTLLSIVNDILDLSRIESGRMEIVPAEYRITDAVSDVADMIRFRAEEKALSFETKIAPEIPSKLYGDDNRIRQILMNLLTNAVKYTKTGSILLKVSQTPDDPEKKEPDDRVTLHFEVEDTGIGIRSEDMEKLFSEFERVDIEHNRDIEGTGLGIPITMKLLKLMGSELNVRSEYGKGSVFSFDLSQKVIDRTPVGSKREDNEKPGRARHYDGPSFTAPDAKILVVDDHAMNRKVFAALLKQTLIGVETAESGYEAVKMTAERHYDMIFMDHLMPGMDGFETMKKIREEENGPNAKTPVFMLSANAMAGFEEEVLAVGFDGFLAKPLSFEELEEVIRNTLPKEKII